MLQLGQGGAGRQRDLIHAEVGLIGIFGHLQGFVGRTQEPGGLTRQLDDVVHHVRQGHERRHRGIAAGEVADRRTETGKVGRRVVRQQLQVAPQRRATTEGFDRRRVVIAHRVMAALDHGHAIHDRGAARQVLADPHPRHPGGDRAELAADLGRRVRLHVPGIVMARPTVVEHQDAALDGLDAADDWGAGRLALGLEQVGQP